MDRPLQAGDRVCYRYRQALVEIASWPYGPYATLARRALGGVS